MGGGVRDEVGEALEGDAVAGIVQIARDRIAK